MLPSAHPRCACAVEYIEVGKRPQGENTAGVNGTGLPTEEIDEDAYRTIDDPFRDVLGSIKDSHPEEMDRIIRGATQKGVEIIQSKAEIAYSPGLKKGIPGQLHLSEYDSYGAWLHEEQHMLDDEKDGWLGFAGLMDIDRRCRMKYNAYKTEIDLARKLGERTLEEKLIELYRNEIFRIGGEPHEFK